MKNKLRKVLTFLELSVMVVYMITLVHIFEATQTMVAKAIRRVSDSYAPKGNSELAI